MEDNLKRLVSEATRISREENIQAGESMLRVAHSTSMHTYRYILQLQIDPNVIAYVACLQEAQKSWDEVTAGASMSSGAFAPALIASLAQLICKVLHQKDTAYLPTAKLQVIY